MRLRNALLTACSAVALVSCGGEAEQQAERRAVGPTIPAGVADRLAAQSDKVARSLESGDVCGAREAAKALRADVTASVEQIPDLYLEDLSGVVNEIELQIPACPSIPPPRKADRNKRPHDDDDGREAKDKKGKGKAKGKGRDDETDEEKDEKEDD